MILPGLYSTFFPMLPPGTMDIQTSPVKSWYTPSWNMVVTKTNSQVRDTEKTKASSYIHWQLHLWEELSSHTSWKIGSHLLGTKNASHAYPENGTAWRLLIYNNIAQDHMVCLQVIFFVVTTSQFQETMGKNTVMLRILNNLNHRKQNLETWKQKVYQWYMISDRFA